MQLWIRDTFGDSRWRRRAGCALALAALSACGTNDAVAPGDDAVAEADAAPDTAKNDATGQTDATGNTDAAAGTDSTIATDVAAVTDAANDGDAASMTDATAETDSVAASDVASDAGSDAVQPGSDAVSLYDPATGEVGNKDEIPPFFDKTVIRNVQITLAPADWTAYLAGVDKPDGKKECSTWYSAQVSIDGIPYGTVGVRCFGNGSQITNPAKPNIRIKFNQFDKANAGPDDLDNLRLKASGQDATYLREPMAYNLVRSLGGHAPYTGWTEVTVNGAAYGLYQTMMHLDSNAMNDLFGNKDGNRYEVKSGCDIFDVDHAAPSDQAKLWSGDPGDGKEFDAFFTAVMAAQPADLLDVLKQHIDVGDWLSVYAVDMVISNIDGLASAGQNFTAYVDTDDFRLRLAMSGADLTFGQFADAWYSWQTPWGYPNSWCKNRKDNVYLRILESSPAKAAYFNKVRHLQCHSLNAVWQQAQTWKALIWPKLQNDPKNAYSAADIEWHFDKLKKYIEQRKTWLDQQFGPCP